MLDIDWDDLRLFRALAVHPTVRAAAAVLGISHSTLSRRLDRLEHQVGAALFARGPRGFALTEAGQALLISVEAAAEQFDSGLLKVSGLDRRLEGPIRLTLPDFLAFYCLLVPLRRFAQTYPDIDLEVDISYAASNLDRREADVAVRMVALDGSPPETLVGRKVGVSYATGYRAANTESAACWLGWAADDDGAWARQTNLPDMQVRGAFNHAELQHHAAAAGLGMAYLPCVIGDNDQRLVRLPKMHPKPARDIWVLTHRDLRETARMKVLRDFISHALADARPMLQGQI
ncbi:LysR family transcriptional regulator [Roseobacter sp. CCS2]|uniref:LysR family transcriptional regulator n=1 Tax=Roseobacter sp. CCS2 TaxID=391593 RepID=UPI00030252C9|nr:LysR family transcriptional regulator [Roseobacter sp. CCS2]